MADLNFPQNPNPGDTHTIGTRTWTWNGTGWQLQSGIVSTNPFIVVSAQVTTSTNSTSTTTGGLIVTGGAGFAQDIWVGGAIYVGGSQVVTTATIGNFGVSNVQAGTDTAVALLGGNVALVWNTSTLQSVTSRGAVTPSAISITNTTNSTSTDTGALIVSGGIGLGGDLYSGGNIRGNYLDGYVIVTSNTGTLTTSSGLQYATTNSQLTVGGSVYANNIFDNNKRVLTGITPTAGTAISITSVSTSNGNVTFTVNNEGVTSLNGSSYLGVSAVVGSITLTNLGVQTLTAGTDTTVSSNTGTITIWNTSTLQSITDRGASTNNIISITNATGSSTSTQGALVVTGGVGIQQNLNVGGTLNVWGRTTFANEVVFNGTATFVYSTNTYYTDNLIDLHTTDVGPNTVWPSDDGKDIGIRFFYYNRTLSTGTSAALVLSNSSQQLEFFSAGTESNTGTFINSTYGTFKTGNITLVNSQNIVGTGATGSRTSVNQQALTVTANGIGVNGDSYFANSVGFGSNINVIGVSTLSSLVVSNTATVSNLNVTIGSTFNGTLNAADVNVTGTTTLSGPVNITTTTNSAGTNSGALIVSGGLGVGGSVNIGGNLFVQGTINATVVGSISTATNLTGGVAGAIPYQTAFGATSFIGAGTSGDILVSRGGGQPQFVNTLTLASAINATNTLSGAFITLGGAGIGKDLWVGGDIYSQGQQVATTATTTLANVTARGATTPDAISITNTTTSTSTVTGALTVSGGVGIGGNANVGGNVVIGGDLDVNGTIRMQGVGLNTITGSTGTFDFLLVEGTGTGLSITGNAVVGGNLTATTLQVVNSATIPHIVGNVYLENNLSVQGNAFVTGTSVLIGSTYVDSNLGVNGNLAVTGTAVITGPLTVSTGTFNSIINIGSSGHITSAASGTTSTTATIFLDSFAVTQYRTVKYLVQVVDTATTPHKVHSAELLVLHDNNGVSTIAYLSQYGIVTNTGELGTWDANYSGGNIVLQFTPNYVPGALSVKTMRTGITT